MILIVGQNLAWQKACTVAVIARGEVNRVLTMREFASSKGPNVARSLSAIGGSGEVICYAGGATGRRAVDYLTGEGIRCRCVRIRAETRTCTTFIEQDGTSTEVIEPSPNVNPDEREEMRRTALARLGGCRLLAIMGTAVAGESEDCYAVLVRAAHERDIPVLMDCASLEAIRAFREAPEVLKVNSRELASIAGLPTRTARERVDACRGIAGAFAIRWFIITLGAAGVEAFDGRILLHAAPPRVEVLNAIGSGDAAAAGAAWALHEAISAHGTRDVFSSRESLREALLSATAMGTANCMSPINGSVAPDDYRSVRDKTDISEVPLP
jgi:1-phosphofructokinase family hexose kinase